MNRRRKATHIQIGFTLLELLVVMVIIGLLVGYVGPRYFSQLNKSERTAAMSQIRALNQSLDQYRLDTGHYPRSEQGLNVLVVRPADEPKWNGPYLSNEIPPDPWGHPYVYRIPGEKSEYSVSSYGKDGQPGGGSDDADIHL